MSRKHLFSVTIKDCDIQTFTAGGKGGQHQNKVATAIRLTHRPSGAVGVARDTRSQLQNKRLAFQRMAETKEFKNWVRIEAARVSGEKSVEEKIEEQVQPKFLLLETKDESGKWVKNPSLLMAGG